MSTTTITTTTTTTPTRDRGDRYGPIEWAQSEWRAATDLADDEVGSIVDHVAICAAEYDGRERQHCAHQNHVVHVRTRHLDVPVQVVRLSK